MLTADHRIHYGPGPYQFGDLWIPRTRSPLPLVVFFHGGWWKSEYDLSYAGSLCAALKEEGIATWSVEYRRVGETGGGWPATFQDAAAGFDHVSTLAKSYPLDLSRVFTMGHSAGGHLAFWVAGRHHLDPHSEIYQPRPTVPLRGAISLAGAVDLRLTIDLSGDTTFAHDKHQVFALVGGTPQDLPDRYQTANPGDLLPFQAPQLLIQGADDDQIPPELPARWADKSRHLGDRATVIMIPSAGHDDVVDPSSRAWESVRQGVRQMIFAPVGVTRGEGGTHLGTCYSDGESLSTCSFPPLTCRRASLLLEMAGEKETSWATDLSSRPERSAVERSAVFLTGPGTDFDLSK